MQTKRQKAEAYFKAGYNCAQAVLLAFAEECGLPRKSAAKLASSFGGGMGRLREVCGALSAMFMAAGLIEGYDDPLDAEGKTRHYEHIRELAARFCEQNGAMLCRELLPEEEAGGAPAPRTEEYYETRPCLRIVGNAAEMLEAYLHKS